MTCGERYISHTPTGWKATKSRSLLFLEEQLGFPIINAGFDHNAIPVNLDDMLYFSFQFIQCITII